MKGRLFYLWRKEGPPQRLEVFDGHDLEKKPEIPESSSPIARLKAAVEKAHEKRRKILNKWRNNGKGY
jgi:hypothetical protein